MGNASIDVTEEMRDNAQIAKGKAVEAIEEGWGILNFRFDDMVWNIQDSWSVSKFWLLTKYWLLRWPGDGHSVFYWGYSGKSFIIYTLC